MGSKAEPWPDWREGASYAPLLEAGRSAFAWEWLRRRPDYREDFAAAQNLDREQQELLAAKWGLHRFEPPELGAMRARPIWKRDFHPDVLEAEAERASAAEDEFDLARFEGLATLYRSTGGEEHLLLSDGLRTIRIDIVEGTVQRGPARFRYRLAGLASVEAPLIVLRRLLILTRSGQFSRPLHPPELRAKRFVAMLRSYDALSDGATQREIAERLLSGEAGESRWRLVAPSLRSRVQRLTRDARAMAAGGYLSLLSR